MALCDIPGAALAEREDRDVATATAEVTEKPNGTSQGGDEAKVMPRAFRIGVQPIDADPYDETKTLGSSTVNLKQCDLPADGYFNKAYIWVKCSVTASTATATSTSSGVGVPVEDGLYKVIDTFQFVDTNGDEIVGPVDGRDLYHIAKYGGYAFNDDPKSNEDLYTYTANETASSSAAGSFEWIMPFYAELVPRDALGTLTNKSQSTPFKIKMRLAPKSEVFVNSATVGGECRVRIVPESYWNPTSTDGDGNPIAQSPPGAGTTQYWNVSPYDVSSGKLSTLLNNSVGYPIRSLGFVIQDTAESRAGGETSVMPDPFMVQLQTIMIINMNKKVWQAKMKEWYDYGPTGDDAGERDNGVYWQPYNVDFSPKPGWETRRGYLRTTDGQQMRLKGSAGAAGKVIVYTNYIGVGPGARLSALTT